MKFKPLLIILLIVIFSLIQQGSGCKHGAGDYFDQLHTVGRWYHPATEPLTVRYAANVPPALKAAFRRSCHIWHQATNGRATFRELTAEEDARFTLGDINLSYVPITYSITLSDGRRTSPNGVTEFHTIDERRLQEGDRDWVCRYVNIYISTSAAAADWDYITAHELGHALLVSPDHPNDSNSIMWWNVARTRRTEANQSDLATLAKIYGY